jgi:purine-binding chemotaxis protein CheW
MSELVQTPEQQQAELQKQLLNVGRDDANDEHEKYLTFELKDMTYGVDILGIKEIIEYGQVTKIPMAPAYIRGVINLRGNVVPIIDLSVRLGKEPLTASKKTCVIILEVEQDGDAMVLGFVVDSVNEVVDIIEESVEATPSFGMDIRTDFVAGMGRVNDRFVVLLDLDSVLSIRELSQFFQTKNEEQD